MKRQLKLRKQTWYFQRFQVNRPCRYLWPWAVIAPAVSRLMGLRAGIALRGLRKAVGRFIFLRECIRKSDVPHARVLISLRVCARPGKVEVGA